MEETRGAADDEKPAPAAVLIEAVRNDDRALAIEALARHPELAQGGFAHEKTALHHAAEHDRVEIAALLLDAGAGLDARTTWDMTPLEWAATLGKASVAKYLIRRGARPNLYVAAALGLLDDVRASFDAAGRWIPAETLLMPDRRHGLCRHTTEPADGPAAIDLAFHAACRNGHVHVADFLRARGASIDATGMFDATALHWAAIEGHREVVSFLVTEGADLHRRDPQFESTPIEWAVEGGNRTIAEDLLACGAHASIVLAARIGRGDLVTRALDQDPTLVHAHDDTRSLLHAAIDAGDIELVRMLLDRGADPRQRTDRGEALADLAERHGRLAIASLLRARARRRGGA